MSTSLAFRFPAGRYHATPYGHHVNEGLIEWPPSPWRILRALISIAYTSGEWSGARPTAVARRLMERLSAQLPEYYLPPAVGTHSRHYMPLGVIDRRTKVERTTLVFDTWVRVSGQELIVTWTDVDLDRDELAMLVALATNLNYLGRSESWVECRVMGPSEPPPESNCYPEPSARTPDSGWEQVALLASTSVSAFEAWRGEQLGKALADLAFPEGSKPSKTLLNKRAQAAAPYPIDLLDCLQKDTTWCRSHGWNWPPGSRRVFYWRPIDAVAVRTSKARIAPRLEQRLEAMLLSLTNASRNDHALPPVSRTLPQAELLHRALVGVSTRYGEPPPELTGRDEQRRPLRGPHEHAHIIPLDLDEDGHLDHVLIWVPMGLGANAQTAIRALRRTFTKGAIEPLRLALMASGELLDFVRLPGIYGTRIARLVSGGTIWQSATPFVPPRFIKTRGRNTVEGQIRAELCSRGFPDPTVVRQLAPRSPHGAPPTLDPSSGSVDTAWSRFRHFKVVRRRGPAPPVACGFAIGLEFERPVSGPIVLGYGSHFGLGLFHS